MSPPLTKKQIHAESGVRGEEYAARYLGRNGYYILQRNYRCKGGEIDIIAKDKDTLVFIEVKTRRKGSHEMPEAALTRQKKRRLSVAATHFMRSYHLTEPLFRFDLVGVEYDNNENYTVVVWKNCITYSHARRYTR